MGRLGRYRDYFSKDSSLAGRSILPLAMTKKSVGREERLESPRFYIPEGLSWFYMQLIRNSDSM
ncbi:MAG: hypothetical protein H8E47_13175 [Anaerolineales bacterium]|nr:hypothetical protein [Anaerolineales bacterium]